MTDDFKGEFQDLQEWFDEKPDDEHIINTRFLFQVIKNLANQGHQVDSFCSESDMMCSTPITAKIIKFNEVKKEKFTFFLIIITIAKNNAVRCVLRIILG